VTTLLTCTTDVQGSNLDWDYMHLQVSFQREGGVIQTQ
jgi:hypothetical protein